MRTQTDSLAAESKRVAETEAKLSTAYERTESQEETIRKQQQLIETLSANGGAQKAGNERLVIERYELC